MQSVIEFVISYLPSQLGQPQNTVPRLLDRLCLLGDFLLLRHYHCSYSWQHGLNEKFRKMYSSSLSA
jgi:hypothetical protein